MEPRPFAFHKMEALLKQMQDPESGVPVRSQKIFLTSIPSAFMGYDLIEWLMEHLNIEESGEAVHLANQLCQYGYLFPVTDCKNLTVKDDNSLYRFQAAYYWPWHHRNPDNVEYAIYLVKRTLRNKQRHALEEYEVDALASLKKNLQNKWELITMQAEEQAEDGNIFLKQSGTIKVGKERKKMEKLVADSQERAYWRVHRPPPGMSPPLEPAPISSLRRNTQPPHHNTQIEILRRQGARSRIKVSQAVESLVSYSSTYSEYDPLLTQPQPSNPWLSDDPSFWQFTLPIVEIPTEKRVKRWALSFEDLLADPSGVEEFTSYLRKEYSHENIRFWLAVKELRHCSQSQVATKVNNIYQEFLTKGAPCEINIDSKTLETTLAELKTPSRFTFDVAAHHVYAVLLKKDCYPRFIRSEHYKNLLANALHPPTKKRFFGFVSGGKKKSCGGPVASMAMSKRRGSDRSLTGVVHEPPPFASASSASSSVVSSSGTAHHQVSSHHHHHQPAPATVPQPQPPVVVPLSSSHANLHDITAPPPRDGGVSPERMSVLHAEPKQLSVEGKLCCDDVYEGSTSIEVAVPVPVPVPAAPGPSSTNTNTSEDNNQINIRVITTEDNNPGNKPVVETKTAVNADNNTGEETAPGKDDNIGTVEDNKSQEDNNNPDTARPQEEETKKEEQEGGQETTDEAALKTEQQDEEGDDTKKVKHQQRHHHHHHHHHHHRSSKEPRKMRLLSDDNKRPSQESKYPPAAPPLEVSTGGGVQQQQQQEEEQGATSGGVQNPPAPPPGGAPPPPLQHNPSTDICPWEDEESCKTEETFVKKYATLGYL